MAKIQDLQDKTIIILHEKIIESIIKDIVTFIMFAGLLYFNHRALSGSTVIDVLFILMIIAFIQSKGSKKMFFGTPQEAIKFLEKKYKNEEN